MAKKKGKGKKKKGGGVEKVVLETTMAMESERAEMRVRLACTAIEWR